MGSKPPEDPPTLLAEHRYERANSLGSVLMVLTGDRFADGDERVVICTDASELDIDLGELDWLADQLGELKRRVRVAREAQG